MWNNCWVVPMGIRLRSCNVYGLGYCPTMSWSAIIIVSSVCDTCTSFATRLRFDLHTFWEIFGWVWVWSLCVQKFWACKFMVSLCLLWSVRWRVTEWESLCGGVWVHRCDESEEWDGADVSGCSWVTAVLSCEVLARLTTKLLRVCVSPCRRLLRSAILHTKKPCRVCIWLCSVIDSSPFVVCWRYCVN